MKHCLFSLRLQRGLLLRDESHEKCLHRDRGRPTRVHRGDEGRAGRGSVRREGASDTARRAACCVISSASVVSYRADSFSNCTTGGSADLCFGILPGAREFGLVDEREVQPIQELHRRLRLVFVSPRRVDVPAVLLRGLRHRDEVEGQTVCDHCFFDATSPIGNIFYGGSVLHKNCLFSADHSSMDDLSRAGVVITFTIEFDTAPLLPSCGGVAGLLPTRRASPRRADPHKRRADPHKRRHSIVGVAALLTILVLPF
jgi:hypothetical protein